MKYSLISNFEAFIYLEIPNIFGLCPFPSFKDSTFIGIYYPPTLWILVQQRTLRGKFQGVRENIENGQTTERGVLLERGGVAKWCQAMSLPYQPWGHWYHWLLIIDCSSLNNYFVFTKSLLLVSTFTKYNSLLELTPTPIWVKITHFFSYSSYSLMLS